MADSLADEVQKFKEECLAKQDSILKILESLHRHQESVLALASRAINVEHGHAQKQHDVLQAGHENCVTGPHDVSFVQEAQEVSNRGEQPTKAQSTSHVERGIECQDDNSPVELDELWELFKGKVGHADSHNLYESIIDEHLNKRTPLHRLLSSTLGDDYLVTQEPSTTLAKMVNGHVFTSVSMCFILINTGIMGYESNFSIQDGLKVEGEGLPDWLNITNSIFNIIFAIELIFRMVALRSWFFISPDWGWNLLDVFVVSISLALDFLDSLQISFLRALRIMRFFRVFKVLRVLKFFRELRRMLLSILASLKTLAWCFLFFSFIIFMFALLFLQGLIQGLASMPANSLERAVAQDEVRLCFEDLPHAMLSLFAAATGGVDWLEVRTPLEHAGHLYTSTLLFYIVFVTVGVLNVLTGIFVSSANEISDVHLAVQSECIRVDNWVTAMLELFHDMDASHTGRLDWPAFDQCMQDHNIQAYLSCNGLQASHARLLFELLADPVAQTVRVDQFVLGILKLKGEAKALDARVLRRMVGILRPILTRTIESQTAILQQSLVQPIHHGESSESKGASADAEQWDHDFKMLHLGMTSHLRGFADS